MLATLEKVTEPQFESSDIFFIFAATSVWNLRGSSSPFTGLFTLSDTELHAFIIKTTAFGESVDHELSLSLDAIHWKVKPAVASHWVALYIQTDAEGIDADQIDTVYASAFEVAFKRSAAHSNHFAADSADMFACPKRVIGLSRGGS